MEKENGIKKLCIKLGGVISTLLVFSPIVVLALLSNGLIEYGVDFWFFLICSILYDMNWYHMNKKIEEIKNSREKYEKYLKKWNKDDFLHKDMSEQEYYESTIELLKEKIESIYDMFKD